MSQLSQLSFELPGLKDFNAPAIKLKSTPTIHKSLSERKTDLFLMVDQLPQRDAIDMSDARAWIDGIFLVDPDRAEWHMMRSSGFGGSEIGGLVRNFLGYRANFDFSAHDCIRGKLLKDLPILTTDHMLRGIQNEPAHAKRFYSETGAKRDKLSYELLSAHQGHHKWMRYSPDDLVNMPAKAGFGIEKIGDRPIVGRILVDYKAPNIIEETDEIQFQYACQLHQGAILLDELGIEISGILLSQYDWANWRLKNDVVPISSELKSVIIEAGNHYWDCVLRGEIPDYIRKPMLEIAPETLEASSVLADKYQMMKAIHTELGKVVDDTRSQLVEDLGLQDKRFGASKVKFQTGLSITASPKFDQERARQLLDAEQTARCISTKKSQAAPIYDVNAMGQKLAEFGIDPEQFVIRPLDPEAVFNELEAAGMDPELIVLEQMRFTVSKPVALQAKQWVNENFLQSASDEEVGSEIKPDAVEHQETDVAAQAASRMRVTG